MRPSRIITAVENELRTSFWAVPALSRVDPVRASGSGAHGQQDVSVPGELGQRVGGHEGGDGADLAGPRESAGHERRTP